MWVLGQEKLSVFLWSQLVFDAKWISFFFEVFQPGPASAPRVCCVIQAEIWLQIP